MADDSTTTITAVFETREAADLAVEHLVQQHGIARPDIFIQSASTTNTAGSTPSGGDVVSRSVGTRIDAPLEGETQVSADINSNIIPAVQRTFGDVGASVFLDAECWRYPWATRFPPTVPNVISTRPGNRVGRAASRHRTDCGS